MVHVGYPVVHYRSTGNSPSGWLKDTEFPSATHCQIKLLQGTGNAENPLLVFHGPCISWGLSKEGFLLGNQTGQNRILRSTVKGEAAHRITQGATRRQLHRGIEWIPCLWAHPLPITVIPYNRLPKNLLQLRQGEVQTELMGSSWVIAWELSVSSGRPTPYTRQFVGPVGAARPTSFGSARFYRSRWGKTW